MELSKQCVSLELAKKLKSLGCKQESCFYYNNWNFFGNDWEIQINKEDEETGGFPYERVASAYTVAELGLLLPYGTKSLVGSTSGEKLSWTTEWYGAGNDWAEGSMKFADTEADARGLMVCFLIEKGLLNVK
jgi:hypothetical protein